MTKFHIKMIWRRFSKLHAHNVTLQIQISSPSAHFLWTKKKIPTAQGMRSTTKLHCQHGSLVTSSGTRGIYLLCKYSFLPYSGFRVQLSQVCGTAGREQVLFSVISQCDWLQRVKWLISLCFYSLSLFHRLEGNMLSCGLGWFWIYNPPTLPQSLDFWD